MNKIKNFIGYEKFDNIILGFIVGLIGILTIYLIQLKFYGIYNLWEHKGAFTIPFLKRSLLAAIPIFFAFSHFDKLFSARGVIFSIITVGIYLVKLIFFS